MTGDQQSVNCVNFGKRPRQKLFGGLCSALDAEPRVEERDSHPRLRIKCGAPLGANLSEKSPVMCVNFGITPGLEEIRTCST